MSVSQKLKIHKRAVSFGAVGRECKEHRKDETFGEPAAKRRCGYSPCIVLQRATFEKLLEVSRCVDYHLAFLQNDEEIINRCMDTVISYCRGELGNNHEISGMSVQAFLATDEAKDKLLRHLRSVMMNEHPDFVNNSLEKILTDLIVLFREYIADRVSSPISRRY